jgi:hypothetical protein
MTGLAFMARMIVDVEPFLDDRLQIDPTPTHDASFCEVGTSCHRHSKLVQMLALGRRFGLGDLRLISPSRALRIEPMDSVAQGLPIHPADPRGSAKAHAAARRRKRQKPPGNPKKINEPEAATFGVNGRSLSPGDNEDNLTQHTLIIDVGLPFDFEKKTAQRAICASFSQKRSHISTTRFRAATYAGTQETTRSAITSQPSDGQSAAPHFPARVALKTRRKKARPHRSGLSEKRIVAWSRTTSRP